MSSFANAVKSCEEIWELLFPLNLGLWISDFFINLSFIQDPWQSAIFFHNPLVIAVPFKIPYFPLFYHLFITIFKRKLVHQHVLLHVIKRQPEIIRTSNWFILLISYFSFISLHSCTFCSFLYEKKLLLRNLQGFMVHDFPLFYLNPWWYLIRLRFPRPSCFCTSFQWSGDFFPSGFLTFSYFLDFKVSGALPTFTLSPCRFYGNFMWFYFCSCFLEPMLYHRNPLESSVKETTGR